MQLANLKLPDPLSRRHLLDGDLEPAKALALAQAYLEDDREVEAIDFLAAAGPDSNAEAREVLLQLQAVALERGDVFLMRMASLALDEEPSAETWHSLAEAATRAGRLQDVETAERLATVGAE
jgi:hypothetical protein